MPENKVNLPSFLYINSDNQIVVGVHGDSVVTDEWNQFIASDLWITVDELPTESMKVRWVCDDGIEDIGFYNNETKQFSTIDMKSENPILYWKPFNL